MADTSGDLSGLQIDTDWKKQAQAEKRRLAEELKARESAPPAAKPAATRPRAAGAADRKMPPASFDTLLRSTVTQALYYLGDLASPGGESGVNLDLAKHHLDTLTVLEDKTTGNLDDQERQTLDESLYEVRMRFVSVASRYIL